MLRLDPRKARIASRNYFASEIGPAVDGIETHGLQQRKRDRSLSQRQDVSHANRKNIRKEGNHELRKKERRKGVKTKTGHMEGNGF